MSNSSFHTLASSPLRVAVPNLRSYSGHSGIGRVFQNLCDEWGNRVQLLDASFKQVPLPLVRNFPYGVRPDSNAHLVLLPRLTGAQALRDTRGLPSVVIVHDVGVVDFPGDRASTDWLTQQSALQSFYGLRYASKIITDSVFTQERLLHYLPEIIDRVSVVHAGVSDVFSCYRRSQAEAQERVAQVVNTSLRGPLLIYVGSETPRKNIGLLLQSYKHIKGLYPSAQLLKVGKAGHARWRKQTMETLSKLNLVAGQDVLFLEQINDELLADAYRAADVFVSASLYEGFGLPALEAMAVGTPVVVTNCGSFPEIVGDAGWVVEPDSDQITQAICEALGEKTKTRLFDNPPRSDLYNWRSSAERYLQTIHEILGYRLNLHR